ncbi:MAG: alanine--tRNA ligase, partial [Candidatus Thermoplasmatota archaeon]|nr:alanine--tRNA ligase [Candidatus Thermoplasmatota archaeon]
MSLPPIDIPYLIEKGYERRKCSETSLLYWSCDPERVTCGDTHLDEYTFIENPLISGFSTRGAELKDEMRERFLRFFQLRDHSKIEPYPILARWRDDIHLTIASIADFQPHVTSGLVDPPANPLTISQPCIRLTDVDAVGHSGRHLTTFEMMAHHVFNKPKEGLEYYWMNRCVELCHELFTEDLGIDALEITYVENPWSGGGNAGPAVEVIVGGLELATLVFMNLEEDEDGEYEIKGVNYSEMDLQIVDTGYGLERFCWAAAGTPTIYEAIYPESVSWLKELCNFDQKITNLNVDDLDKLLGELSKLSGIMNIEIGSDENEIYSRLIDRLSERKLDVNTEQIMDLMKPLSKIYAIPDHLHALCNMLGDGLVPSNAKEGYLARMMARRVMRMRDELGIEKTLPELAEHHIDVNFNYDKSKQKKKGILEILSLEEERYIETLRRGKNIVANELKKHGKDVKELPDEFYFQLNDSQGIPPEMAVQIANNISGGDIKLRMGFNAEMAQRHADSVKVASRIKNKKILEIESNIPETELLYYQHSFWLEFNAKVMTCQEISHENESISHVVIMDKTAFYPEGGGQEADFGEIIHPNGTTKVLDCQKQGNYVIHFVDSEVPTASVVHGIVDYERRKQLMDHHTGVHIIGGAARKILGPHVFQAGSNVSEENGRLDITHYERLTRDDLDKIETLANQVLQEVDGTIKSELDRKDADQKYGFDLYQGGAPKTKNVRILEIGTHDIQACGGTHHDIPGKIGQIRIVRSTLVQDGVERLQIVAGNAALRYGREQDELIRNSAATFGVSEKDLPKTSSRFFEEWKLQRKKIEQLEAEIIRLRTSGSNNDDSSEIDGVRIVIMEVDNDIKQMTKMVGELTLEPKKPTLAIIGSRDKGGKLLVAVTEDSLASERYDASKILKVIAKHIDGSGGGRPTFAQGGGSNSEGIPNALSAAKTLVLGKWEEARSENILTSSDIEDLIKVAMELGLESTEIGQYATKVAIQNAIADGHVDEKEATLIKKAAELAGFSPEQVKKIFDAVSDGHIDEEEEIILQN